MNGPLTEDERPRVMIVDDDETTLAFAQALLSEREFRLLSYADPREAWTAIQQQLPDLLITDVLMPHLDGFELCRRLRQIPEAGDLPILVMTAIEDHAAIQRAYASGATDFTTKPVNWELESHRLHYLLRTARTARQLRRQEEETRRAKEEWERTFHSITDLVLLLDENRVVRRANAVAAQVLGRPLSDILGQRCDRLFGCGDSCPPNCPLHHAVEVGEPVTLEWTPPHLGGYWHTTVAPLKDAPNGCLHYVVSASDLTAQRRMEESLRRAQKLESVGRLAGGVAHDFNNMLSVILNNLELALEKSAPDTPLHAHLREIQQAASRSAEITKQLLALARKQPIQPRILDLNQQVEQAIKLLRRLLGENIDLKWQAAPQLPPVLLDPAQLDQILTNLCINARDAIAGVGELTIETRAVNLDEAFCASQTDMRPGAYVLLKVSDTGSGMSAETLNHLFEPFYTTKESGKGTGLGLATILGIVKQNRGCIQVTSQLGQGSTFHIYLPSAPAGTAAPAPPDTTASPAVPAPTAKATTRPETILFVEDEPSVLKPGCLILRRCGYRLLSATTPREAIALVEQNADPIDLLITDVVMPGMNGKDLQERILQLRPNVKILYISGYTSDVIAEQGILDEGVHFLQKPFTLQALAAKAREVLDGA